MDALQRARIKKQLREENQAEKIMQTVARDFGTQMGLLVRQGVPPDMAFEATRERMVLQADAMLQFATMVETMGIDPNKMESDRLARAAGKHIVTLVPLVKPDGSPTA